jgi:hypothetical protein
LADERSIRGEGRDLVSRADRLGYPAARYLANFDAYLLAEWHLVGMVRHE